MALTDVPSSSPAFATPAHPILPRRTAAIPAPPALKPSILPIILPPATLRPQAFRTFTKKHNLTLTSAALAALATFVGRHCGSGWREQGLAEGVLEEVAKSWKKCGGAIIVDGEAKLLRDILKTIEGCMSGGKVLPGKNALSRQGSFAFGEMAEVEGGGGGGRPALLERESSFGMSGLQVEEEEDKILDPREWIKVISTFEQPRLVYNANKKHFELSSSKPSLFPSISSQTTLFRNRYQMTHARILRNEHFQPSTVFNSANSNQITPIANLLGRTGSQHLLLALLGHSPTGTLCLSDLTGSIALDLQYARPVPSLDATWFTPGMLVLVEGTYEEDYSNTSTLGNTGGVGGTINGRFMAFSIAHPPCERRSETLGVTDSSAQAQDSHGPAFGWTDFLGVGSERATGSRMRRLQRRILGPESAYADNTRVAIAGEINLDNPAVLSGLRVMLESYASLPHSQFPVAMVFIGNFASRAVMSGAAGAGSIEYKECFNGLAAVLAEFPQLIARTTLVFVPGDSDAWASSFSGGAAAPIPRSAVPDIFTTRVKRVVAESNREVGTSKGRKEGEAIWTTNPSRLTWFGTAGEMVLFRDDISSRLRRTAIKFSTKSSADAEPGADGNPDSTVADEEALPDAESRPSTMPHQESIAASKRLTKSLLDQSYLSPFPLSTRPVHWAYASALSLYPLPTSLVVADAEVPAFVERYYGCCVMNPGRLVEGRKGDIVRWVEFDIKEGVGKVRGPESRGN